MGEQQMFQNERILALDTATSMLTVSLLTQGQIIDEHEWPAGRHHSTMIVPAIQSIMKRQGWTGDKIDLITVGKGPGSYTGIRVAVSVAKTMAWVWQKPVLGISSLHALAQTGVELGWQRQLQQCISGDWVIPLIDARRGQVYTARFIVGAEEEKNGCPAMQREHADGIRPFYQLVEEIQQAMPGFIKEGENSLNPPLKRIWLMGEVMSQREVIEGLRMQFGERIQAVACTIKSRWIGKLGRRAWRRGEFIDAHRLEPNYTQLAEAEAKQLTKEQAVANVDKKL